MAKHGLWALSVSPEGDQVPRAGSVWQAMLLAKMCC